VSSEQRAIGWLLLLGAAGVLVRFVANPPGPPGAVAYRSEAPQNRRLGAVAAQARRLSTPLRKGDRIDLDTAGAEEIQRLPRIGPGLAARIVADREKNGPFGSLEGLDRVSGVGPSLLEAVRPYAAFSGVPRAVPVNPREPAHRRRVKARAVSRLTHLGSPVAYQRQS